MEFKNRIQFWWKLGATNLLLKPPLKPMQLGGEHCSLRPLHHLLFHSISSTDVTLYVADAVVSGPLSPK